MQKLFIALLLSAVSLKAYCQNKIAPVQAREDKLIQVKINKNVEFLGFVYYVGFEGAEIERNNLAAEKKRYKYGYDLYQRYKSHAQSPQLAQSIRFAQHIWLDDLIKLLIQLDDFPNATLNPNVENRDFIRFSEKADKEEAAKNVQIFLEGLNKFYREVDFDTYLQTSKLYYENALTQVDANMPSKEFVSAMEGVYKKSFDSYTLIPSLTLPAGMGFGVGYSAASKTYIFNVFGALVSQNLEDLAHLNTGFDDKKRVREKSTHEFGHSFVNPVIDQVPIALIEATKPLYEPIKTNMTPQNYISWKACLYEHFVRAGEILIAKKMKNDVDANNLLIDFEHHRKFIYLRLIIEELEKNADKPYQVAVIRAMRKLKSINGYPIQRSIAEKDNGRIYSVIIKAKKWGKSIEHKQNFGSAGLTDAQKDSIKNHLLDSLGLPKLIERAPVLPISVPNVIFNCAGCAGKSEFEVYGANFTSTRKGSPNKKSKPLFPLAMNLSPGEYKMVYKQRKSAKIKVRFTVKINEKNVIKVK